jgi:hypothetical protein
LTPLTEVSASIDQHLTSINEYSTSIIAVSATTTQDSTSIDADYSIQQIFRCRNFDDLRWIGIESSSIIVVAPRDIALPVAHSKWGFAHVDRARICINFFIDPL